MVEDKEAIGLDLVHKNQLKTNLKAGCNPNQKTLNYKRNSDVNGSKPPLCELLSPHGCCRPSGFALGYSKFHSGTKVRSGRFVPLDVE